MCRPAEQAAGDMPADSTSAPYCGPYCARSRAKWPTSHRAALRRQLWDAVVAIVLVPAYERLAVDIDNGFGAQAIAAVAACPPGPARAFEVARWARRAWAEGIPHVAYLLPPHATDSEVRAVAELHAAIVTPEGYR